MAINRSPTDLVIDVYNFIKGSDEKEAAIEIENKRKRRKTERDFKLDSFLKRYHKSMKAAKPYTLRKPDPQQELFKSATDILKKFGHMSAKKAKFAHDNIINNNKRILSSMSPNSQGLVLSTLQNKFMIQDQEVPEESSGGISIRTPSSRISMPSPESSV